MAHITYKNPKVASWVEELNYLDPKTDDAGNTIPNEFVARRVNDPRKALVKSASINSVQDVLEGDSITKKILVQLDFTDGVTTHTKHVTVDAADFDKHDDDVSLLRVLLSEHFAIN